MSNAHYPDAAVSKLRTIVAVIDQEIVQAPSTPTLRAAWAELVDVLALGPSPQTRECPVCHRIGMRAASRCGTCWTALQALPPVVEETAMRSLASGSVMSGSVMSGSVMSESVASESAKEEPLEAVMLAAEARVAELPTHSVSTEASA